MKIIPARDIKPGDVVARVLPKVRAVAVGALCETLLLETGSASVRPDDEFVLVHRPEAKP